MPDLRILACGDNHGDTESLEKVLEQTQGEEFDFVLHTGDITNTWMRDLQTGIEQIKEVEPYFEELTDRGTLVYVYGNRDKERAPSDHAKHVTDEYELDVGHHLSNGEPITVDGQRFTCDPSEAEPDDILLTHGLYHEPFYQSPTKLYVSGDTHRARQYGQSLNTGYLHNNKGYNGAFYTVTLDDDGVDATVHGIDEPWKGFVCSEHEWYGTQFTPAKFGCGLCQFGVGQTFNRLLYVVFDDVATRHGPDVVASIDDLVSEARDRLVDDDQFESQLRRYLEALAENENPGPRTPFSPVKEKPNHLRMG